MTPSPPLRLAPRRSRLAALLIVVTHGATAALLAAMPLPFAWRAAGVAVVVAAGSWAWRRCVGRGAAAQLEVGLDRRIAVTARDGRTHAGDILADSFVGPRLTTIVWRPDRARSVHAVLVLPDVLAADDFRRLRVTLRYSRAGGAGSGTSGVDAA